MPTETNKPQEPPVWTVQGLLDHFMRIHEKRQDRSFAFLLGAGASVSSGIPLAGDLARKWVNELYIRQVGDTGSPSFEDWADSGPLGIPGFKLADAATFYPQVYDRRFGDDPDPEAGYAYLEDEMAGAHPNIGYSILAKILEATRHKVVITTNFDNLVADALSIYTGTFPLVCAHESLTGFVRSKLRRPLVAKIHRDLLLAPQSGSSDTSRLSKAWADTLPKLLAQNTLIVLGYGGNDGGLMGFLESLDPGDIEGGILWCYRAADSCPNERICALVAKHKGPLIPIVGFDEFMVQLGQRLEYPPLADQIEERARERATNYRRHFEKFVENVRFPAKGHVAEEAMRPVRKAIAETAERETGWWAWGLKAHAEKDPEKAEAIYREGLSRCPNSFQLAGNFATFMTYIRENYDEAEQSYRRAIELDPTQAINTGNFANFMTTIRKNHEEAERLYRRALELDPKGANVTGNFANFMWRARKNHNEAERLYRRALELDPKDANVTANFASFMTQIRKNHDEAERLYRRALALDPKDANVTANFASFMSDIRKNHDEAERLYRRALERDPKRANVTGNFANFTWRVRKDYEEAERLYRRAIELDPKDANVTGNFASFVWEVRKNFDEADRLYRLALELDPERAENTGNFASFMWHVRKDYGEAERLYRRALELDPNDASYVANHAGFLLTRGRLEDAKAKIARAWLLTEGEQRQLPAELCLYWCWAAKHDNREDTPGLARLKSLVSLGFQRDPWDFDEVLAASAEHLSPEERQFYTAVAAAILDSEKIPELDRFERWGQIKPIPIDQPWDMAK
ncbi:MAG: tetratricopeptide repeat protein [Planctomycetota bacterium]